MKRSHIFLTLVWSIPAFAFQNPNSNTNPYARRPPVPTVASANSTSGSALDGDNPRPPTPAYTDRRPANPRNTERPQKVPHVATPSYGAVDRGMVGRAGH